MIAAVTIAEPVAAWLQAGPRPLRVHSAFPRAINVVADDGRCLTLLACDADDGPFTLRLPCRRLPNVPAGTPVRANHSTLALGPLVINWQQATHWDPTLEPLAEAFSPQYGKVAAWSFLVLKCLHASDSLFVHAFDALSSLTSLSQPFGLAQGRLWERGEVGARPPELGEGACAGRVAFRTLHATRATTHLAALLAGLQGDDTALATAVRALLGFGEGLTPAGDDCLLGVLAARRMLGQPAGVLEDTICDSASRTTALSAAFLRAACDGHFVGHWHNLRDALESGDPADIRGAACHILTHGATSGADALVGWVVGMES